jgi:hypothetical protein
MKSSSDFAFMQPRQTRRRLLMAGESSPDLAPFMVVTPETQESSEGCTLRSVAPRGKHSAIRLNGQRFRPNLHSPRTPPHPTAFVFRPYSLPR